MARTCTLKGKPLTLEGPELKPGDAAPNARLTKSLVDVIELKDLPPRVRIYSVVPSLDTSVCAEQTRRFHQEAAKLQNVDFYTISCDLPPSMNRFCGAEGINTERMRVLSDHMDGGFGKAYGTLIPSIRIESRAVFVVDERGKIRYAEYVPEVANHPNYDAVLACVKKCSPA